MTKLALDASQGIAPRRYPMPVARNVQSSVGDPAAARAALGRLVGGIEADTLQISSAKDTPVQPGLPSTIGDRLYVGITWPGVVLRGAD